LIYTAGSKKSSANKSARVTTNDTTLGSVTISFKAQVVEPGDSAFELMADPPTLDFSPIDGKITRKLEAKVENTTDKAMELSIVSFPPDFFDEVELNRTELKPGKEAKLKVELTRADENKQFWKSVTVEGISPDNSKFRVTIPVVRGVGSGSTAQTGHE
jgi:uncharacterized cupredoxin-like copper-binding protein